MVLTMTHVIVYSIILVEAWQFLTRCSPMIYLLSIPDTRNQQNSETANYGMMKVSCGLWSQSFARDSTPQPSSEVWSLEQVE